MTDFFEKFQNKEVKWSKKTRGNECRSKSAVQVFFEKKEDITNEIVVDVNVPFFVIVHGIAFADLNFLNQPHQRGTV